MTAMMDDMMAGDGCPYCHALGNGHFPGCWLLKKHIVVELEIGGTGMETAYGVGNVLSDLGKEFRISGYSHTPKQIKNYQGEIIGKWYFAGEGKDPV